MFPLYTKLEAKDSRVGNKTNSNSILSSYSHIKCYYFNITKIGKKHIYGIWTVVNCYAVINLELFERISLAKAGRNFHFLSCTKYDNNCYRSHTLLDYSHQRTISSRWSFSSFHFLWLGNTFLFPNLFSNFTRHRFSFHQFTLWTERRDTELNNSPKRQKI